MATEHTEEITDDPTEETVVTELPPEEVETETATEETETDAEPEDAETFTREYVENLRDESAKYRTRAKDRDDLAERLHTSLVAATGRLADPSDLTFDNDHLTDPDALTTAIDDLLTRKPHLGSRKPSGDIGQGATGSTEAVDLAGMLRARAV